MSDAGHAPGPAVLSHDPLWPRAGDWRTPDMLPPRTRALAAVLGIPTWRTSLSPTGAHATPAAVRDAVRRYSSYAAGAGIDLREHVVLDLGDVPEPDGRTGEEAATAAVARAVALAELAVVLGGDNAATVPALLGSAGSSLATAGLVTVDAHHDLRDGVSNGAPVRRLVAAGLRGDRVVQVGIAEFANSREYTDRARDLGVSVITRDELRRRPIADAMAEALDVAAAGGGPVHVDLDVDVCDRAVAPACPASVPGGISAYDLRMAARVAAADPRVRSMDLTEVDATADAPDGRTVRLVALCLLEAIVAAAGRSARPV
jgi:formiminoglutamase